MAKTDHYWESDWYRAEKGLPPLPAPEPPPENIPSDDELAFEIAPYCGDPIAIRKHIDERLHRAMEAQARQAEKGDIQAARALVALTERRAKMLGLDAPKEIAMQVATLAIPKPLKQMNIYEIEQALAESRAIEGEATRED